MLTKNVLKLWFKYIDAFNTDRLLNVYKREKVKKENLEIAQKSNWNIILNKIQKNLELYSRADDFQRKGIIEDTVHLKVILDLIKDLDYN